MSKNSSASEELFSMWYSWNTCIVRICRFFPLYKCQRPHFKCPKPWTNHATKYFHWYSAWPMSRQWGWLVATRPVRQTQISRRPTKEYREGWQSGSEVLWVKEGIFVQAHWLSCTPSGQTTNALVGDSEREREHEQVPSALAGGELMVAAAAANECNERPAGGQTRTTVLR